MGDWVGLPGLAYFASWVVLPTNDIQSEIDGLMGKRLFRVHIITVFGTILIASFSPKPDGSSSTKIPYLARMNQENGTLLVIIMLSGLIFSGALWGDFFGSCYCVTPSEILTHTSIFGQTKIFTWDDAKDVQPYCQSFKGHGTGGLDSRWVGVHITHCH
jgi:hypothetical protein